MLFGLLPPLAETITLSVGGLIAANQAGAIAGWTKAKAAWDTGYSRKLFHFIIFNMAALFHFLGGFPAVNAFATGVSLAVLWAVWRGQGDHFYEAMARERDAPRRSEFILIPLLTTALGGILSNLLTGPYAIIGYLTAGWGDAAGEPIGHKFGRHPYRSPSLFGVPAIRTIEGSVAIFAASAIACWLAFIWSFGMTAGDALLLATALGALTAAVESISPHGTDNVTTMVLPSLAAMVILS